MIKSAIKYICLLICGTLVFWACEPCEDCGPDNAYPYFNLSILNESSLDTLKKDTSRLTRELEALDILLDNPENAPKVDSLNNLRDVKSDSLALINARIKTTNEKIISIEAINGETNLFENRNGGDSLSNFRIPLNTLQSTAEYTFEIEFADSLRYMKIEYELIDTTINDKITKAAKNLRIIEHRFDTLIGPLGCSPISECISNEINIYVEI